MSKPNLVASLTLAFGLWADLAAAVPQSRAQGVHVAVSPQAIRVVDGDTARIHWSATDAETVRILGIDTAELLGRKGRIPLPVRPHIQPRGAEARGFARGAFAVATRIELLRSANLDRYGRTLGYFFLDGRNYSVLVIEAGLSRETISHYGDNDLPREAAEVKAAKHR